MLIFSSALKTLGNVLPLCLILELEIILMTVFSSLQMNVFSVLRPTFHAMKKILLWAELLKMLMRFFFLNSKLHRLF